MVLERAGTAVLGAQVTAFEAALCEVRQRVFMSRGPGFRGASQSPRNGASVHGPPTDDRSQLSPLTHVWG